ncbi:MAG: nicotinamide riboside transporter PnuC [Streptococcaceae bacterium]|jgi:nicotinamide mononucleotide transporter|nr:nicotinamide riboside transporter PnuC [Streptococcaceae bacterium]
MGNPINNEKGTSVFAAGLRATFGPKRVWHELTTLNWRDYTILAAMFVIEIGIWAFVGKDFSVWGFITLVNALATYLNLILVNRGRITNYLWGVINTAAWIILSFHSMYVGDALSQAYYMIMQFVGIYLWQKNLSTRGDSEEVTPLKITWRMVAIAAVLFVVVYMATVGISQFFHGQQIHIDGLLLPLGIVGMLLMTYGYRSQWAIWTIIDAINVYLWILKVHVDGGYAVSMLTLQIVMLLNCFYGTYLWFKKTAD